MKATTDGKSLSEFQVRRPREDEHSPCSGTGDSAVGQHPRVVTLLGPPEKLPELFSALSMQPPTT